MSDILAEVYPEMFRKGGKRLLYELHLLLSGQVEDGSAGLSGGGAGDYLPMRLPQEQRDEADEAIQLLWAIIATARLERTSIGRARLDPAFAIFKEKLLKPSPVTSRKTAGKRKAKG